MKYWGEDWGREFDILIDGKELATQVVNNNRPGRTFEVVYPVGEEFTKGKDKVVVRFQAHAGKTAGGVFGCAVVKAGKA